MEGDTVVAGARLEAGSSTNVNSPDNDDAFQSGAAYVFAPPPPPPPGPDVNLDGRVTPADAIYVINRLGNDPAVGDNRRADVNGDNIIDQNDVQVVLSQLGTTLP